MAVMSWKSVESHEWAHMLAPYQLDFTSSGRHSDPTKRDKSDLKTKIPVIVRFMNRSIESINNSEAGTCENKSRKQDQWSKMS